VHVKLPLPSEVHGEPAGTASSLKVTVWEVAKPVPLAVVVLPTSPRAGLRERNGPTVNDPAAVIVPSAVVFAAMAYDPEGEAGTVTLQVKEPFASTSTVPSTHKELAPPKYGVTGSPEVKPDPVRTTSLPTIPLVGLKESAGSTVNDPGAGTIPSSVVSAAMV
jgi:hypothetical protein